MTVSRRDLMKMTAGVGALGALSAMGVGASLAQTDGYRAMVGIFLFGGCDSWNMIVPTDGRYAAYASGRGASLALKPDVLTGLSGTPFGLHPSFAPLKTAWSEGALNVVLNAGSLFQPLNRTLYTQRPDLRPLNLMSHADGQAHWQGMRVRDINFSGFLGRIADRMTWTSATPPLISTGGSNLALIGARTSPLVLPSSGPIQRSGHVAGTTNRVDQAREAAFAALADAPSEAPVTRLSAQAITAAYDQATAVDAIVSAPAAAVDAAFIDPATGKALTSDVGRQLLRVARMIEARVKLGHDKQAFFVSQGGWDTHADQVAVDTATGRQAVLFSDLAMALSAFYQAVKGLGLEDQVTAFTMSDFGRVYKANAQRGTDHAWGGNYLVLGGALKPQTVHGRYPDQVFGGQEDAASDGRWIPSISIEEYLGSIVQWYGVAPSDMTYVFPNWANWNSGGRGPVPFFA